VGITAKPRVTSKTRPQSSISPLRGLDLVRNFSLAMNRAYTLFLEKFKAKSFRAICIFCPMVIGCAQSSFAHRCRRKHVATWRLAFAKCRRFGQDSIIRQAAHIEDESPIRGEVEIDDSYFGGRRKGKRGRGAAGKVPVFGILKRGGRVYTKMLGSVRKVV
jgi:hypothetical protein